VRPSAPTSVRAVKLSSTHTQPLWLAAAADGLRAAPHSEHCGARAVDNSCVAACVAPLQDHVQDTRSVHRGRILCSPAAILSSEHRHTRTLSFV
jgi:hypothetical protein